MGSNSHTAAIIEQSFLDSIRLLNEHLKARPYLFGRCPSLADFGLWGQLYQCFQDVLAGELLRLHAPHVALWCEARKDFKDILEHIGRSIQFSRVFQWFSIYLHGRSMVFFDGFSMESPLELGAFKLVGPFWVYFVGRSWRTPSGLATSRLGRT